MKASTTQPNELMGEISMSGWTEERRQKQSEAIRRWKPWEQSTGPKTEMGKHTASGNSLKHGRRSSDQIEARRSMVEMARRLREQFRWPVVCQDRPSGRSGAQKPWEAEIDTKQPFGFCRIRYTED